MRDNPNQDQILTMRLASGHEVTLSRSALETYGQDFIQQLTIASNQEKLLLIDSEVIENAQQMFPDSETPLIEAYRDHFLESSDWQSDLSRENLSHQNQIDALTEENVIMSQMSIELAAFSDPVHRNGAIIIPDGMDAQNGDNLKHHLAGFLSHVNKQDLGNLGGTSLDWAKTFLLHEAGHLNHGHSRDMAQRIHAANLLTDETAKSDSDAALHRSTLQYEIEADSFALREMFGNASGAIAQNDFFQSLADIRTMAAFHHSTDIYKFGGDTEGIFDHDTRSAYGTFIDSNSERRNLDQISATTSYTNTLVHGLVGAVNAPAMIAEHGSIGFNSYQNTPLAHTMGNALNAAEFENALNGDDPMRIVGLGNTVPSLSDTYAATLAIYENGGFDHAPDAKNQAQEYLQAVARSAPGLIDEAVVAHYREQAARPENRDFLTQLHRYYEPEQSIGYMRDPQNTVAALSYSSALAP